MSCLHNLRFLRLLNNGSSQLTGEFRRDGISDNSSRRRKIAGFEFVEFGESLQQRALPQGKRPVLLWMPKASTS